MVSVCIYLQVHQPCRLRKFTLFDMHQNKNYFDDERNAFYLERIAKKSYLPMNALLKSLIEKTNGRFRFALSITGVALEQFEKMHPDVLESFKELVDTGCVELLSETFYHSLAFLYNKEEFMSQINLHKKKIKKIFGQTPKIFRNTELMFNNELANFIEQKGYEGILCEGADHILGWRSPNFLYSAKTAPKIKLLLKNYKLSDDIAFRFSCREWKEWPLTADKYASWISNINGNGDVVNLFMDYETFGEHQWKETGIFKFMEHLPYKLLEHPDNDFKLPSEVIKAFPARGELDIHHPISWADTERDLSAWTGNRIQQEALHKLYELGENVIKSKDKKSLEDWRKLQTSDHFYYMCTKWFNDGDVHKYFNPYDSPYEAFITFMNILQDLQDRVKRGVSFAKKDSIIAQEA